MISSPSGFSVLEYDDATGQGNTASLTDGKGRATFSGLFISEVGEGFVCRFVAYDTTGVGVAWVDSDPFDVVAGLMLLESWKPKCSGYDVHQIKPHYDLVDLAGRVP